MNLLKVVSQMRSGEIVKRNGHQYSEKTVKFYEDVVKTLSLKPKDTLKDVQARLLKRGISSVTTKNYIDAAKVLFKHAGIEFQDVKIKVFESPSHIPDPARVWKMIREFKPETKQESWGLRYLTAEFLTSARYSDLSKLNQSNIHIQNGQEYLVYFQSKTGKRVSIPITPLLKSQFSETGNLLPKIPYSSLCRYIKQVYKKAGFDRDIKSTKMVNGEIVEVFAKEYEVFGSHRMRASAITGLLQKGLTELEVKQISGHSKNSRSFSRYVEHSQNHIDNKYLNAMK